MEEIPTITLDVNDIVSSSASDDPTVEADTTTSDSSTEGTNDEAKTLEEEPSEGTETDGEETDDDSEGDADAESTEDSTDETPTDEPKNKSAEGRIRNLVAENRQLREQITQQISEAYKAPSAQEIFDQAQANGQELSPAEARVVALEQRQEITEFNAKVSEVNMALRADTNQVLQAYPMFDENSPQYNPELTQLADAVYKQSSGMQIDPKTGLVYDVKVLPSQVYESIARAHEAGASTAQVKAQRSAEKMLAAADTPTSAAPKQKADKTFLSGFDAKYRVG